MVNQDGMQDYLAMVLDLHITSHICKPEGKTSKYSLKFSTKTVLRSTAE